MILVAGGQLDFNIGRLLGRMLQRRVPFVDVLVGPKLVPSITLDLANDELRLNGAPIHPTACFMRHDVFLQMSGKSRHAQAAALNWYNMIKGWELARPEMRVYRIGDETISFHLTSRDLDYREHDRVKLTLTKAPRKLERGLRALTERLGLDFAAADFMRNRKGEYCFLEVNTQP